LNIIRDFGFLVKGLTECDFMIRIGLFPLKMGYIFKSYSSAVAVIVTPPIALPTGPR